MTFSPPLVAVCKSSSMRRSQWEFHFSSSMLTARRCTTLVSMRPMQRSLLSTPNHCIIMRARSPRGPGPRHVAIRRRGLAGERLLPALDGPHPAGERRTGGAGRAEVYACMPWTQGTAQHHDLTALRFGPRAAK